MASSLLGAVAQTMYLLKLAACKIKAGHVQAASMHQSPQLCDSASGLEGGGPDLHDGAHSSAVTLPHAAETGLSPNVPELSEKRRGRRGEEAVSGAGR